MDFAAQCEMHPKRAVQTAVHRARLIIPASLIISLDEGRKLPHLPAPRIIQLMLNAHSAWEGRKMRMYLFPLSVELRFLTPMHTHIISYSVSNEE